MPTTRELYAGSQLWQKPNHANCVAAIPHRTIRGSFVSSVRHGNRGSSATFHLSALLKFNLPCLVDFAAETWCTEMKKIWSKKNRCKMRRKHVRFGSSPQVCGSTGQSDRRQEQDVADPQLRSLSVATSNPNPHSSGKQTADYQQRSAQLSTSALD